MAQQQCGSRSLCAGVLGAIPIIRNTITALRASTSGIWVIAGALGVTTVGFVVIGAVVAPIFARVALLYGVTLLVWHAACVASLGVWAVLTAFGWVPGGVARDWGQVSLQCRRGTCAQSHHGCIRTS